MDRISGKVKAILLAGCLLCTSCGSTNTKATDDWLDRASLDAVESPQELYEKALTEDILILYTVSTRAAQVKDSFEAEYPGLSVEIRDLRSPSLVEAVEENARSGLHECDVVLCNDNSGDFKSRLVDTGLVVPYLPSDIRVHMKDGMAADGMVSFLNEAQMLFYNTKKYDSCPIENLWALTEPEYHGRIYMPNPLRSFSTYAFCGSSLSHTEEFALAYTSYTGLKPEFPDEMNAAEFFWTRLSENIQFTNSSDEVIEALRNGNADFGFCVSSKMRFQDAGYNMEPVWNLQPFSGCRTSFSIMLARGSENINTAKLFIRYLLGEADGQGEGYKPFCTAGTWSAREDVADGTSRALETIDLIIPDEDALITQREEIEMFWAKILQNTMLEQP